MYLKSLDIEESKNQKVKTLYIYIYIYLMSKYIYFIFIFHNQYSRKKLTELSNVLIFITSFEHPFPCSKAHITLRNKK